jgi:hypothetical protein
METAHEPTAEEQELCTRLQSHLAFLKTERQQFESLYDEVYELTIPDRKFSELSDRNNTKTGLTTYTGKGITALSLLVNGLHGYLVSPAIPWFRLGIKNPLIRRIPMVADWLEEVETIFYECFNTSGFYQAIAEYFADGATTYATISIEYDPETDAVVFRTIHPKEIYIAEDATKRVKIVFRLYRMTAYEAFQMFGNNAGRQIQEEMKTNPFQYHTYLHAVYPRKLRDPRREDNLNMAFESVHINQDENRIMKTSGYRQMPYLVWRWSQNSGSVYPRTPGVNSLVDMLRLNALSKSQMKAVQLAIEPPLNVPEEMKGQVRFVPQGLNYYKTGSQGISPIQTSINYPLTKDVEDKIDLAIETNFYQDFFLMLARAQREMTAREVIERQGEKAAVLGAIIGRLNTECLNPLFDRVWDILERAGKIPPPPAALVEAAGGTRIDVEYIGPLAQAQKRYHQTQGVIAGLQTVASIAQMDPNVMDIVNMDEAARYAMDNAGMPQKAIRETTEVQKIRTAKQKALEQQQKIQQMQQMAQAVPGLSKAPERGSPIAEMDEQLKGALQKAG